MAPAPSSIRKTTKENDDPDYNQNEPSNKRRKSSGKPFKSTQNTPSKSLKPPGIVMNQKVEPFVRTFSDPESKYSTEPTIDKNIFPDATYSSYDEFEQKFNIWKSSHLHPFRVASSESLRTEEGTISERFKYRYVVFHCARYGAPRMRGEGKRPNQNYLPCSCTAMIRLNFNFNEQCLKLTSLETRHSNHTLCKELYDKMVLKEEKRKHVTPRRRTICTTGKSMVTVKKEPIDDGAELENTPSNSNSPVDFNVSAMSALMPQQYNAPVNAPIASIAPIAPIAPVDTSIARHLIPKAELLTSELLAPYQALHDYQMLQNQFAIRQFQVNMNSMNTPYIPFTTANWTNPLVVPTPPGIINNTSAQISPVSTSVDENEAPKVFHSMETVRPIALHASENSAFTEMLQRSTEVSPIPKVEIDSVLGTTSRMLHDSNLPQDVLQNRIKQLNNLIAQWGQ